MSDEVFFCPDGPAQRADKILASAFPDVSRSRIKRAIESGQIRRADGTLMDPKSKLKKGDCLLINLFVPQDEGPSPVAIPLNVIFEDESVVVVDKAPGMIVHPGDGTGEDTLVHALLHHCPEGLSPTGGPDRPGIVHRLDKETSGAIVVAKTDKAYHCLVRQFSERKTGKVYDALVGGHPRLPKGEVSLPIGRHPKIRVKMAVVEKGGKPAHTEWKTQLVFQEGFALLECRILTGRTHQIRVHLSSQNHPLAGDATYGYNPNKYANRHFPRVMLHARQLTFCHPETEDELSFTAPMPDDFKAVLSSLSAL